MRRFFICFLVALLGLLSTTTFADDNGVKIYNTEEYKALVDSPQLMVPLGVVTDFGTLPFATESGVTKDVMKKAAKIGATGIYVVSKKERKGDNGWGVKGFQLHIAADAFTFIPPSLSDIRSAIHSKRNTSSVATQNAINLAQKAGYAELADDLLDEILNGKKGMVKPIMLTGYVTLKGAEAAVPGLKQVAYATNLPEHLVSQARELLPTGMANDALYRRIVDASDTEAARLMPSYAEGATTSDIPNLRKLLKLHSSDTVRIEAGKALVRLKDTDYVQESLASERSQEVARAVKKEMLRN